MVLEDGILVLRANADRFRVDDMVRHAFRAFLSHDGEAQDDRDGCLAHALMRAPDLERAQLGVKDST